MSYVEKDWESRDSKVIIKDKYHTQRYSPTTPLVKERRKKSTSASTAQQIMINMRHRTDRLNRLILDNFSAGDWWVTFTISKQVSLEKFKTEYEKMMRKLRDEYRKLGAELKYITVKENIHGKGRLHGHMLLPNIAFTTLQKIMRKAWKLGNCNIKPYGGTALDAKQLASYITKEDTAETKLLKRIKAEKDKADKETLKKLDEDIKAERSSICTSRNLVRREPKKRIVKRAETYSDAPRAPRGYHIVKQLSYSGYTADGYPYQHTVFERGD